MTKGSCLNLSNSRTRPEPYQQRCDLRGNSIGSIRVVFQVSWKMVRVSGSLTGDGEGILQGQAAQGSQAGHCMGKACRERGRGGVRQGRSQILAAGSQVGQGLCDVRCTRQGVQGTQAG